MQSTEEVALELQKSIKNLADLTSKASSTQTSLLDKLFVKLTKETKSGEAEELAILTKALAQTSTELRRQTVARREAELSVQTLETRVEGLLLEVERLETLLSGVEPDPGPGDPGPSDPGGSGSTTPISDEPGWPLQFVDLTTEDAKSVRPPGFEERAAALKVRSLTDSYMYFSQSPSDPIVLQDLELTGPTKTYIQKLISLNWGDITNGGTDFTWSNLSFKSADPLLATGLKWFGRLYNVSNLLIEDVHLEGQPTPEGQSPEEHGYYANVSGDSLIQFSFFSGLGGKPLYFAHREFPYPGYDRGDNSPYTRRTTHVVDSVVSIDNDQDAKKGSFAATWFDCGSATFPAKIHVKNCVFVSKWDFVRSSGNNIQLPISALQDKPENIQSCGALMVTCYQQKGTDVHSTEEVLIEDCLFNHFGNKKNPLGIIRNTKVVHFKGCVLNSPEGENVIHVGSPNRFRGDMLNSDKLIIENCDTSDGTFFRFWNDDDTFEDFSAKTLGVRVVKER